MADALSWLPDRIFDKIAFEPNTGCWLWASTLAASGYGMVSFRGRGRAAHRVVYELCVGPIPEGMRVLHSCDVRSCVAPQHLRPGTRLDNARDMVRKGRAATGERNGSAKLTEREVRAIRTRYALGGISRALLGAVFGISSVRVGAIVTRRAWKHALDTWLKEEERDG